MNPPDELSYERAALRVGRLMLVFASVGTLLVWALWGWRSAAGFGVGAVLSGIQYQGLKAVVETLGGKPKRRPGFKAAARFLVLASVAYVIFRLTPISLKAALAGVFVLTAAVFVEVAFEIAYARRTLDH